MSFKVIEVAQLLRIEIGHQLDKAQNPNNQGVLSVPCIMGPVGIGKTDLVHDVASEYGLELLEINCAENGDPTDISGMPVPWETRQDAEDSESYMLWVLNQYMHIACERGVLLFFDDVDKMPPLVEGALLGIIGKRKSRHRRLHPATIIVCAGNRSMDDRLARDLSESLKTRLTIINMEPSLTDFVVYAERNPGKVHPLVLGYLHYRPGHLHKVQDNVARFPTSRGWVEASHIMYHHDADERLAGGDHYLWNVAIELKCGAHIAADFWAWYTIVRGIDITRILREGVLEIGRDDEAAMMYYAAIFAVTQDLNTKGVKASYKGLPKFIEELAPEHQVAMLIQLTKETRKQLSTHFSSAATKLIAELLPDVSPSQ